MHFLPLPLPPRVTGRETILHAHALVCDRVAAQSGEYPPIYAVDSTSIFAKFTSVFLVPFVVLRQTLLNTKREDAAVFVNSIRQYRLTRASFHAHQSQARWFRTLFVCFSRYLWYVSVSRVG